MWWSFDYPRWSGEVVIPETFYPINFLFNFNTFFGLKYKIYICLLSYSKELALGIATKIDKTYLMNDTKNHYIHIAFCYHGLGLVFRL